MYENLTRLDLVGPALARALGDPGWERLEASLVSGGKSNLTFELTSDAGEAVLRRPPDGPLLPRAHDMGRGGPGDRGPGGENGRAAWRGRGEISVGAVSFKKKKI